MAFAQGPQPIKDQRLTGIWHKIAGSAATRGLLRNLFLFALLWYFLQK